VAVADDGPIAAPLGTSRALIRVCGAIAFAASVCCGRSSPTVSEPVDDGSTYFPAADWRTANAAAVGLDQRRVDAMWQHVTAGRYGSIQGLLVVRHGYLAVERYANWPRAQVHTMQSVTKSVTSLLFGIATATAGDTAILDRPVLDLFSRYASVSNVDDRKRALTVRHLLTMRTGMDFWEQPYAGSPLDELNRSAGDWTKLVLDRPMADIPGTGWAYNSGAAILIGSAIRELVGESADAFARHALFAPIGVTGETWVRSPFDGLPHCGGGLYLKPLDLARVGYLVLRHGAWGDRQVVPRAWLDASTQAVTKGAPVFFSEFGSGYGRFWWLFPTHRGGGDDGIIAASGSGGQWLFVVPSLDLVVAIVASNGDGLDLLYDDLLPAVGQVPGLSGN